MTLLFDIYPATGHFNASFALANKLQNEQHRIVYCADPENEMLIKNKGFECIVLDYPIEPDKNIAVIFNIKHHHAYVVASDL